jgi:hypothetical protein
MLLEPTAESPSAASEPVRHHDREPTSPAPAYTGGIFNLGAPADKPYRNLDYLLEDDEPKSGRGFLVVALVALALVAGLGYLRWRDGGLPGLKPKTSTSQTAPATVPNPADSTSPSPAPEQQNPASAPSAQPGPAAPASTGAAAQSSSAAPPANPPATSAATNPGNSPTPAAADSTPPAAASPSLAPAASDAPAPDAANDKPAATPANSAPAPADTPPAKPKPAAKPKAAARPQDPVTLGEQYLYGRGVPQSCERGLRYVKPAADQANAKAMITMGALYATGHCLSRDLPTAYRFFALALRADPENGPLRQNAEMVWRQMTAEERKQAIRLTQ